jgi:hypothetical protein
VKLLVTAALGLVLSAAAASGAPRSGLRGVALIEPGYPVCKVDAPCTRPAARVLLVFSRQGRTVARVRTSADGRYRVTLKPTTYRVTSPQSIRTELRPKHATVRRGLYRKVTFKLDVGIR